MSARPPSILDLPARQLEVLVAFACSWELRGRQPTYAEIGKVRGRTGGCNDAVLPLVLRGLLEQQWRDGRPVPHVYQPTGNAWRQLAEYGLVRPAEAA